MTELTDKFSRPFMITRLGEIFAPFLNESNYSDNTSDTALGRCVESSFQTIPAVYATSRLAPEQLSISELENLLESCLVHFEFDTSIEQNLLIIFLGMACLIVLESHLRIHGVTDYSSRCLILTMIDAKDQSFHNLIVRVEKLCESLVRSDNSNRVVKTLSKALRSGFLRLTGKFTEAISLATSEFESMDHCPFGTALLLMESAMATHAMFLEEFGGLIKTSTLLDLIATCERAQELFRAHSAMKELHSLDACLSWAKKSLQVAGNKLSKNPSLSKIIQEDKVEHTRPPKRHSYQAGVAPMRRRSSFGITSNLFPFQSPLLPPPHSTSMMSHSHDDLDDRIDAHNRDILEQNFPSHSRINARHQSAPTLNLSYWNDHSSLTPVPVQMPMQASPESDLPPKLHNDFEGFGFVETFKTDQCSCIWNLFDKMESDNLRELPVAAQDATTMN